MKAAKSKSKPKDKPKDTAASRWLSYRPEIKVLDCTIRDGGLAKISGLYGKAQKSKDQSQQVELKLLLCLVRDFSLVHCHPTILSHNYNWLTEIR